MFFYYHPLKKLGDKIWLNSDVVAKMTWHPGDDRDTSWTEIELKDGSVVYAWDTPEDMLSINVIDSHRLE